jgi:hypothetical protein
MNWIKDNKFVAALGSGTLVGAVLLFLVGSHFGTTYDQAKEAYDMAADEAAGFVRLPLYPKPENKAAKKKALDEYRRNLDSLQTSFEPFRPKEIKDITPQDFTTRLLSANSEIRKAFEEAGAVVPEAFFVGFEGYKTSLAAPNTTGILDYQLGAIKHLLLDLAKAKPTELKNLFRPALPEEDGKSFTPAPADVARSFPLEITFTGREESVRQAFTAFSKIDKQYVVIRSIRISNIKKDPPKAADAKFGSQSPAAVPAAPADTLEVGFVFPGDPEATSNPPATPAAQAPQAASKAADSGRILSQVLGDEELQVFVRLDVLQFLPAKKLP